MEKHESFEDIIIPAAWCQTLFSRLKPKNCITSGKSATSLSSIVIACIKVLFWICLYILKIFQKFPTTEERTYQLAWPVENLGW